MPSNPPSSNLRHRPLILFVAGLLIFVPCLLLQKPRSFEEGNDPLALGAMIGFVLGVFAASGFIGTSSRFREMGRGRKAYLIGVGIMLFGCLAMGIWDYEQNHHPTQSFIIPVLITGVGLCVAALTALFGLASCLLTLVPAGAAAVPRRVWVGWSALMLLVGALLVVDVQRARKEANVGDDIRSSSARRIYVHVSDKRVYGNMHEFETGQGTKYCTAVIDSVPQEHHRVPKDEYRYGRAYATIYGKYGTVPCIRFDVSNQYGPPIDLRNPLEHVWDYFTLSCKPISGGFVLLLLAGVSLVGLMAHRGRKTLEGTVGGTESEVAPDRLASSR